MKLLNRKRWPHLVTYADTWQGHTGHIYKAANWKYVGETKAHEVFVRCGKLMSKKIADKTYTRKQMIERGCEYLGSFSKHKFVHSTLG